MPPADSERELWVVSFDGKGVPMIKAEAVKLKAKLSPGEQRQRKQEALVGVSYTVDTKPGTPEARAELLVIRKPRGRVGSGKGRKTRPPAPSRCGVWPVWYGRSMR